MADPPSEIGPKASWFLLGVAEGGRRIWRIPLDDLPFTVGRRGGLQLTLPSDAVSSEHAEIYAEGSSLFVRDLGSTNGTFVNRDRIEQSPLQEGDIVHFSDFEFRLGRQTPSEDRQNKTAEIDDLQLPSQLDPRTGKLMELLRDGLVTAVYQPIVLLGTREVVGIEALGRGRHPALPEGPVELLAIASAVGSEPELSRLFRRRAIELLSPRRASNHLFVNTHPKELERPGLMKSLEWAREAAPHLQLTLEVHEQAIASIARMKALRRSLDGIGVGLAYDDFGAGQARLLELADVPPDFLKFDMSFIRDIDTATTARRRLVASRVEVARDVGSAVLAEGVETLPEVTACVELGFSHAQGYYFGRPAPDDDRPSGPAQPVDG